MGKKEFSSLQKKSDKNKNSVTENMSSIDTGEACKKLRSTGL